MAEFHQRKQIRANFHDYSGGCYFITICTLEKRHYLGEIHEGTMHLSSVGQCCEQQLKALGTHYPYAQTLSFVVMPNHIHAIIHIDEDSPPRVSDKMNQLPSDGFHRLNNRTLRPCVPTKRTALSVIVGGIKREVTLFARRNNLEFDWQSRYHDHIIREMNDMNRIATYIENNVSSWENDCFYDK